MKTPQKVDLNSLNTKTTGIINCRLVQHSIISMIEHTDRLGDAAYNRQLSENRSMNAALALGRHTATIAGLGESVLMFDNNLRTPDPSQSKIAVILHIIFKSKARFQTNSP